MIGDVGYPDLTLVRGQRVVFAELKAEGGRLRAEQRLWLAALDQAPVEVYTWTPADWPEVEATLTRRAVQS